MFAAIVIAVTGSALVAWAWWRRMEAALRRSLLPVRADASGSTRYSSESNLGLRGAYAGSKVQSARFRQKTSS
jgi:hypothetical protein